MAGITTWSLKGPCDANDYFGPQESSSGSGSRLCAGGEVGSGVGTRTIGG